MILLTLHLRRYSIITKSVKYKIKIYFHYKTIVNTNVGSSKLITTKMEKENVFLNLAKKVVSDNLNLDIPEIWEDYTDQCTS